MVSKAPKMRGQAFITFKDISDAANAMKRMQGFPFYEKAMNIAYSRRESHVITQAKKYVPAKDERTLAKGIYSSNRVKKRFEIQKRTLKLQPKRKLLMKRSPRLQFTSKICRTKQMRAC